MSFALDTMVVSELRKAKPHGGLLAWLEAREVSDLFVPAHVLYEVQAGIEKTRRQDATRAEQLSAWLDGLPALFHILPLGGEAARETARLMRGLSSELFHDAAIAATARVHGLTVATRNTRHFERFGVPLINPYETERRV